MRLLYRYDPMSTVGGWVVGFFFSSLPAPALSASRRRGLRKPTKHGMSVEGGLRMRKTDVRETFIGICFRFQEDRPPRGGSRALAPN
jgi:hypothetical protein